MLGFFPLQVIGILLHAPLLYTGRLGLQLSDSALNLDMSVPKSSFLGCLFYELSSVSALAS